MTVMRPIEAIAGLDFEPVEGLHEMTHAARADWAEDLVGSLRFAVMLAAAVTAHGKAGLLDLVKARPEMWADGFDELDAAVDRARAVLELVETARARVFASLAGI